MIIYLSIRYLCYIYLPIYLFACAILRKYTSLAALSQSWGSYMRLSGKVFQPASDHFGHKRGKTIDGSWRMLAALSCLTSQSIFSHSAKYVAHVSRSPNSWSTEACICEGSGIDVAIPTTAGHDCLDCICVQLYIPPGPCPWMGVVLSKIMRSDRAEAQTTCKDIALLVYYCGLIVHNIWQVKEQHCSHLFAMAPSLLCREGAWLERGEIVAKTLQLLTMTDLALEARALEHVEKSLLDFTVAAII